MMEYIQAFFFAFLATVAFGVLFQVNDDIADVGASDTLQALKTEWEGRLAALSRETGFTVPFPAIP